MKQFIRKKLHIVGVLFFLLNNHSNFFSKAQKSYSSKYSQNKIFENFDNNAPDEDQPQNSSINNKVIPVTAGLTVALIATATIYSYKQPQDKPFDLKTSTEGMTIDPQVIMEDKVIIEDDLTQDVTETTAEDIIINPQDYCGTKDAYETFRTKEDFVSKITDNEKKFSFDNNKLPENQLNNITKDQIELIQWKLNEGTDEEKVEEYLSILQKIITYTEKKLHEIKFCDIDFASFLIDENDPKFLNQVDNLNSNNIKKIIMENHQLQDKISYHISNIVIFFRTFPLRMKKQNITMKKELFKKIFNFFLSNKNKIIKIFNLSNQSSHQKIVLCLNKYNIKDSMYNIQDLNTSMIIMFYNLLINEKNLTQKEKSIVQEYIKTCDKIGLNNNNFVKEKININELKRIIN